MTSKLIFASFTLTNADTIGGVTWNRCVNAGDDLNYGTAAMADVKFSVLLSRLPSGVSLDGQRFTLQFKQSGTYVSYGIFTVLTAVKSGNKLTVTACDNMAKFDIAVDTWLNGLSYPTTLYRLLSSLCTQCGVTLGSASITNGSYSIAQNFSASGITGRSVLSYIAQASAAFAYIGTDGKLYLSRYSASGVTIDSSQYIRKNVAEYAVSAINKVQIRTSADDIGVIAGSGTNTWIIENNPLLYTGQTSALNSVASNLLAAAALTYNPASVELFEDYGLQTGDTFTLDGVRCIVMAKSMKPSGVTLTCTGYKQRQTQVNQVNESIIRLNSRTNELIRELDGTLSRITTIEDDYVTSSGLTTRLTSYSTIQQTSDAITNTVTKNYITGKISGEYVTPSSLSTTLESYSTIQQTSDKIASTVSKTYITDRISGEYVTSTYTSTITQTANKISWLISSGTDISNFTMTNRAIDLVSANINLTGYVTFNALSGNGTTTINGSNITTGTLSASRIGANYTTGGTNYINFTSPIYSAASVINRINTIDALQFRYGGGIENASDKTLIITSTGALAFTCDFATLNGYNILTSNTTIYAKFG